VGSQAVFFGFAAFSRLLRRQTPADDGHPNLEKALPYLARIALFAQFSLQNSVFSTAARCGSATRGAPRRAWALLFEPFYRGFETPGRHASAVRTRSATPDIPCALNGRRRASAARGQGLSC
jgi:hypothetical protein